MTTPPEPPPAPDDESGTAEDRFDRRIAFAVVAALAVAAAFGPFGWHLLPIGSGVAKSASAATSAIDGTALGAGFAGGGGGGAGSNAAAAVATSPSANPAPAGTVISGASASCATALGTSGSVTSATGTPAAIGAWAVTAAPSIAALRTDSATLHAVVVRQETTAVPTAAKSLCDEAGSTGQLAAMPDAVGATAWQAALSAFVAGATDALAGSTHPAYYEAAQAQLAQGNQELDALTAHITAVAAQP